MKEKKKAQGTQPNFVGHDVEQLFSGFHFSIKVQSFSILLLLRLHTLSLATQKLKIYIFFQHYGLLCGLSTRYLQYLLSKLFISYYLHALMVILGFLAIDLFFFSLPVYHLQ